MPNHNFRIIFPILIGLALLVPVSHALTFDHLPNDFDDLVLQSSLAFRGEVIDTVYNTVTTPTTGEVLAFTSYTFRVDMAYLGTERGREVTIHQYGGYVDTEHFDRIAGVPLLETGDLVAIFANDADQPLTATLFADLGLRRFVDYNGQLITLSAHGTALFDGPAPAELEDLHHCEVTATNPTQCDAWLDEDGERTFGPFADSTTMPLTATAFDQRVLAIAKKSTHTGPAQTLGDAQTYAQQLALFFDSLVPETVDEAAGTTAIR